MAICSQGPNLDSPVDPRFGRCAYLVLVGPEGDELEAVPNAGRDAARGAGIQTARMLVDRKVEAVLAAQVGPNALAVLEAAGIKVYGDITGTVAAALRRYRQGELTPVGGPTVSPGWGGQGGRGR